MRATGNTTPEFPDTDWRDVLDALAERHHVVLPAALLPAQWRALREEAAALLGADAFAPAQVGRALGRQREVSIRSDHSCWLTADMAAGGAWLRWMDGLRIALNRDFFLGLAEYEAHYAHYPAGAFYRRHVDRHRDSNARVVTSVFYLNEDWAEGEGGELVLHDQDDSHLLTLPPRGGTLALFMSADMPHEVLPAQRERWSIAGWFRTAS